MPTKRSTGRTVLVKRVHRPRNQGVGSGRPRSRFYKIAHRVAENFEPTVADSVLSAVSKLQDMIDLGELQAAVASGNEDVIEAAAKAGNLRGLLESEALERALQAAASETGQAGADVLSDVTGLDAAFEAFDPKVVAAIREQAAELVVNVGDDTKEAIRIIVAVAQEHGLTTVQQARAIRELVGLPSNWASAPLNLEKAMRDGDISKALNRRLSAADKAKIRKAMEAGEVTDELIEEMREKYTASLKNRRALNISRTETIKAVHEGQRNAWSQAARDGVLPDTARRIWVVTPDSRLRESHAAIPGMNPDGVPIDGGTFDTPEGSTTGPPLGVNCRCAEGLRFPGLEGVI